jgi:hypothetical protein
MKTLLISLLSLAMAASANASDLRIAPDSTHPGGWFVEQANGYLEAWIYRYPVAGGYAWRIYDPNNLITVHMTQNGVMDWTFNETPQ